MAGHVNLYKVLCLLLFVAASYSYYFEPGFDHHYTYSSKSNLLGFHDITTVIKFRVNAVNRSDDANGNFHRLHMDSFIQHSQDGYMTENPKKWDMSRSFLFQMSENGLVTFVHYHPEDHDEVVTLKKVLASVLSANVKKFHDENVQSFTAKEVDHTGDIEHKYEISRKAEGLEVKRVHQSSENVHRLHNKTMLYDHGGTVHKVIAEDSITLRKGSKPTERKSVEGEYKIEDEASGDFPTITSTSLSQVKLTNKRRLPFEDSHQKTTLSGLISDILIVVEKPEPKKELSEVNDTMESLLQCIRSHKNKFAANRTECVIELRKIFTSQLNDEDYKAIAEKTLKMKCDPNDTVCSDHKNLFIDLITRKGDNDSQSLMIKYLLQPSDAIEKEKQRCLLHCIALEKPLKELVLAVEEICFGKNDVLHGTEQLEETQRKACLTLGALAKTIQNTDPEAAHRIVNKVETWLDHHNETKSNKIIKPRMKRSVTHVDKVRLHHIVTKMALIHVLGNAGMSRSVHHIVSYLKPNQGALAWRRAAVRGLRYFKCNKSADALFLSSIQDDSDIVRDMAFQMYQKHPKGSPNITAEQRHTILSQRYTYPVLMRLKRGVFDVSFKDGLYFAINIPGIDWQKVIGSDAIGASFGLVIRNRLEIELKPLEGHFEVDVYDTAYAEAHCGVINLQFDIFKALLCYKGHIGYELNILKDFGINDVQDLAKIFDKVVGTVVDPIKKAVEAFKNIINFFKNGGIQKLFNEIVAFIKNLPQILKKIAEEFVQFVMEAVDFGGFPIIQKIKNIVIKIRTFIEDVQEDVMGFYHTVVDSITVTLPYIGKSILDAIATIVSSMKNLLVKPGQAISGIAESIIKIKMAISMFIDVKNQILDACFFTKGKTPFWLSLGDELRDIISAVTKFVLQIKLPSKGQGGFLFGTKSNSSSQSTTSDGILSKQEQLSGIKLKLVTKLKTMFSPLSNLSSIGKPFYDAFKSIMDVVQSVKSAYEFLRNVVQKGKSMIQKVFGPKFDKRFPKTKRKEVDKCGQGIWPTTTEGAFKTTGVDVLSQNRAKIPMPLNGMIYKTDRRRVLIQPKGSGFRQNEIIIENIIPNRNITSRGIFVNAGETIGIADRSQCQPNFIHVAMRKKGVLQHSNDEDYDYIDPSTYLDKSFPVPKWIEDCNDHVFTYLGQTADTDAFNKKGAKRSSKKIDRGGDASDKMKEFESMDPSKEPAFRPQGMESTASVDSGFKNEMSNSLGSFGDVKNMFTGGSKAQSILDVFDVNKFSITKIQQIISGDSNLKQQLDDVVEKLAEILKKSPIEHPDGMSIPDLRRAVGRMVEQPVGDKSSMISDMLSLAETDCPTFVDALAKGFGHVFTAHPDCLGITCGVSLTFGSVYKIVKVDARVDKCNNRVQITANGIDETIDLDGEDHEIILGIDIYEDMSVKLVVNGLIQSDVILSVDAMLCSDLHSSCLPDIQVLTDVKFPDSGPCRPDAVQDTGKGSVYAMTLQEFQSTLSQYHLLDQSLLKLFMKIRDVALEELMKNPRKFLNMPGNEFQDKMDICIKKDIPVNPFDITFFDQSFRFMVGPVPIGLGFGAGGSIGVQISLGFCFLSLSAKATVTPFVGGKVWGSLTIDIGFARGGIRLIGYLLETQFPITATIGFSKFPLDVTAKMDMILTPIRLVLKGFAELFLLIKYVTVFEADIWHYKAPTIRRNIFTTTNKGKDNSPPEFTPSTMNSRRKREGPRGCILKQLPGRSPVDTAFTLEVATQDELSDVKMFYAIGTQSGGTNVVDWTEMGGASLEVPRSLPGGIPLHWTVKAGNSEGLFAYTHCHLETFDSTIPDGRVDPSYIYSSHPNKLSGTVVVFDDSPLVETHSVAIGYSPGQFGSEFVSWKPFTLQSTKVRQGESNELKYFSIPKTGKLTSKPFKTVTVEHDFHCARECVNFGAKCVSFDFEYHSETCDLQEFVQGPSAKLRESGTYKNYERLGVGSNSYVSYQNLDLSHGTAYYINAAITNSLGYKSYLVSEGTIVDFTTPETGPLGIGYRETMRADGCKAAITQRCVEVTWLNNHRKIIDGKGAKTVFNGHKPLEDLLYTRANHYASVNFDGFRDNETGIWGYTWAFGRNICGTDVVTYRDPHEHLSSRKYWTNSGYMKGLQMEDGPYFATVQALNNIVYGGALVTTVCKSTPIIVDTTPPFFGGVTEIFYDEDFDLLGVYFKAYDLLSNLSRVDFGLGKTKHDVLVRGYSNHAYVDRKDPFVAIEELGLQEGVPAWIRLRAVNNVDLFEAGHGDEPILIDRSPPIPGAVLDGELLRQDIMYQSDPTKICAQWVDFYDPESGIDTFSWGVGTEPQHDNIVRFHNLTHHHKHSCADVTLHHNTSYYSTVAAFNTALNSKQSNGSSDGVLVDLTPPLPGWIKDGKRKLGDIAYSSESATKDCFWGNFTDPESDIAGYEVSVYINSEFVKAFDVSLQKEFVDHSISMKHLDTVDFSLKGTNGAGLSVVVQSDGFLVDHTPPDMDFLHDTPDGSKYQSSKEKLNLKWKFDDTDSGIKEYRYFINQKMHGTKSRFWPQNEHFVTANPTSQFQTLMNKEVDGLSLIDGAKYSVHVTAINGALMSTSHESEGVIVDTTPPVIKKVHIGLLNEDEEFDDSGTKILHVDPNSITVSWKGRDPESGITNFYVAIGKFPEDTSVTSDFLDFGTDTSAHISGLSLDITEETNTYYYVSVKATNGAGISSTIEVSKPIIILKANVPGVIYDGRDEFKDTDYTTDKTSVALTFGGFESEACNIVSYEWAIGSEPYQSDILPYTNYGLVLRNETHGHAQIHVQLYENSKYYTTVRAKTGHNCHDEYIVSTSDGLTLDTEKPVFDYIGPEKNDTRYVKKHDTLFQSFSDSVDLTWSLTDKSPVKYLHYTAGRLPFKSDIHNISSTENDRLSPGLLSLPPGEALFLSFEAEDDAGNVQKTASAPVMSDTTAPVVRNFTCTPFVSTLKTSISCQWLTIEEFESILQTCDIRLGTYPFGNDLHPSVLVLLGKRSWTRELPFISQNKNLTKVHVTMNVHNILDQKESFTFIITVDQTPPEKAVVEFTTRIDDKYDLIKQLCQVPTSYVEINVRDFADTESGIDRVEICLGTSSEQSDVKEFMPVQNVTRIFVGGLTLEEGSRVYATARIYNKAGLYSLTTSDPVVISPNPILSVEDGPGMIDIDYQSELNVLQGRWTYSDPCPIVDAKWEVEDLTGKVIQNFQHIPGNQNFFYNDELDTINGYLYFNKIRTRDALNRIREAVSDGVAIRIQTPNPGYVRDGLETNDIEYQQSVHELSCNWDSFGDKNSKSPTQRIIRYEVAIGNDRRYTKTRSNVHYFVDVGLNNSFTFKNLNLTSKVVKYYITVRAYSEAGSFEEGYSNGVRVGFEEGIVAGTVEILPYQFETDKISVSWSSFMSDIGIRFYQLAISTKIFQISNTSVPCKDIEPYTQEFDVYNLTNVGLDKYRTVEKLALKHNTLYYPTVVGVDESDMCMVVTGAPVRVDTSPPDIQFSYLRLNGRESKGSNFTYITDLARLTVEWNNVTDHESGIESVILSLEGINNCPESKTAKTSDFKVSEIQVINDTKITLYDLGLFPKTYYFIKLLIKNRAGLKTELFSPMLLVDTTPPFAGTVKIGREWENEISFQFPDDKIHAFTAIAKTEESYVCPNQLSLFPNSNIDIHLHDLKEEFSKESVEHNDNSIVLKVGYNIPLTKIIKGGIESDTFSLREGNFTFKATTAGGKNIISTFSLSSLSDVGNKLDFSPPLPDNFDTNKLNFTESDNIEDVTSRFDNTSTLSNDTSHNTTETVILSTTPTFTASNTGQLEDSYSFGFGVHVLGELQDGARKWDCVFWAVDRFKSIHQWITLDLNPMESNNEYIFGVKKEASPLKVFFNIALIINGEVKSTISGMQFPDKVHIYSKVWNRNGYEEPLVDPFKPFQSQAEIFQIKIPTERKKQCFYGTGFYDGDSGIQEMWVGVSDSLNVTDNISPMTLYKEYCLPCENNCNYGCDPNCVVSSSDFEIDEIDITGLSLESTKMTSNSSLGQAKTYYVNVKMKNFAGEESMVTSNPIMIDKSPPECEYIRCVDPRHSEDEPTEYIGSDSMIGAYWSCTEDISEIKQYIVSVGTAPLKSDMYNETDFKLQNRIQLNLTDTSFEHGKTYYLNLFALNSADQSSSYYCHVHVELYPPDVSSVTTQQMYSDKPIANSKEAALNSSLTHFNDRIGVQWNNKEDNIALYEWKLGTEEGKDDIIPRIKVGVSKAGDAAILQGHLILNGTNINTTTAQFAEGRNWTGVNVDELKKDSTFFMEPGRCIHNSLYAVGRSHLTSEIPMKPTCVKRSNDLTVIFNSTRKVEVSMTHTQDFKENGQANADINIAIEGESGGVLFGYLEQNDLQQDYGTAATFTFKPFIVDPESTKWSTSIILRDRLVEYQKISFFMSPASEAEFQTMELSIVYDKLRFDNDTVPAIVMWDAEQGLWKHVAESCASDIIGTNTGSLHSIQVCLDQLRTNPDANRRKRSTTVTVTKPTMFSVFKMNQTCSNRPPVIDDNTVTVNEDQVLTHQIQWHDNDSPADSVVFTMTTAPQHGRANITLDGYLNYFPAHRFSGKDEVTVLLKEVNTSCNPHTVTKVITINVVDVNDPPVSGFLTHDKIFYDTLNNNKITLKFEGNNTSHFLGRIILADVDYSDTLVIRTNNPAPTNDGVFILKENITTSLPKGTFATGTVNSFRQFDVYLNVSKKYHGELQYQVLGYDKAKFYTQRIDLHVFILWAPCVHGHCSPKTATSCNDVIRASTYDIFTCTCTQGYEGVYCQNEVNECRTAPCPLMYDCYDKLADYECNINPAKLMAILICIFLAGGIVVGLVWRKLKKRRGKWKVSDSMILDECDQSCSLTKPPAPLEIRSFSDNESISSSSESSRLISPGPIRLSLDDMFAKPGVIPRPDNDTRQEKLDTAVKETVTTKQKEKVLKIKKRQGKPRKVIRPNSKINPEKNDKKETKFGSNGDKKEGNGFDTEENPCKAFLFNVQDDQTGASNMEQIELSPRSSTEEKTENNEQLTLDERLGIILSGDSMTTIDV